MVRLGSLPSQRVRAGAFFIGVAEDAEPVEPGLANKLLQKLKIAERLAGEADDEAGAEGDAGDRGANLLEGLQEDLGARAALHSLENFGRGVLERHIEILADVVVFRDGLEQAAGDAVRICIEKPQPAQPFDPGQRVEQCGKAVLQAQVFAVAGGVLADEGDLLDAARDKLPRFGHHRLEPARAELCRAGWE